MSGKTALVFSYYVFLTTLTIVLLVVLGNWLGILGVVLAFLMPMAFEIVRSLLQLAKKSNKPRRMD